MDKETQRLRVTVELTPEDLRLLDGYQAGLLKRSSEQKDWMARERIRRAAGTRSAALRFLVSVALAATAVPTMKLPARRPAKPAKRKSTKGKNGKRGGK